MRAILFILVTAFSFSISIHATVMDLNSKFVDRWQQKYSKFEEIYESKPREQKFTFGDYQLKFVAHVQGKKGWFGKYSSNTPMKLSVYIIDQQNSSAGKLFSDILPNSIYKIDKLAETNFGQAKIPFLVLNYSFDKKGEYYATLEDFGTPWVFSSEQVMELLQKLQIKLNLPSIYFTKKAYQEGYFHACFKENCINSNSPPLDPNWIYLFMQEEGSSICKRSFFESFGAFPDSDSKEEIALYFDAVDFLNKVKVDDLIRDYRSIQDIYPICESLANTLEHTKTKLDLEKPNLTVGSIVRALKEENKSDNRHMHRLHHQFQEEFFGRCASFFLEQAYYCFTEDDNSDVYDFHRAFSVVLKKEFFKFKKLLKEFNLAEELSFSDILNDYSFFKKQLEKARLDQICKSAYWLESNDLDGVKRASDLFLYTASEKKGLRKMLSLYDPLQSSKEGVALYSYAYNMHFPNEEREYVQDLRILFQDDIRPSQYSNGYLALLWNWAYYIVLRQENFVLEN